MAGSGQVGRVPHLRRGTGLNFMLMCFFVTKHIFFKVKMMTTIKDTIFSKKCTQPVVRASAATGDEKKVIYFTWPQ